MTDNTSLTAKSIAASRITLSQMMSPQDANNFGNVHGGVIMKQADEAGALTAMRHAQAPTVTVAVDSMTFVEPILVGNLVLFNAELTYVGRTSMEVRVEVIRENPLTGEQSVSNTAYFVYVALDDTGRPRPVPPIAFASEAESERAELAARRQAYRREQRQLEASRK